MAMILSIYPFMVQPFAVQETFTSQGNFRQSYFSDGSNIYLQNNYANLLIDLGEFDRATDILNDLLHANPNYDDKLNLNRIEFARNSSSRQNSTESTFPSLDPLLQAFDDHEVESFGRLKSDSKVFTKIPDPDQRNVGLDKIKLAEKAVAEGSPAFALDLCSHALQLLGPEPCIYDCAADAYISLKSYANAERAILHAALMHGLTIKHCINLISISCMTGDINLANYYLERAYAIDPSNDNLETCKSNIAAKSNSIKDSPYIFSN